MTAIDTFKLTDLQPSQFYISAEKLRQVRAWFCPEDLSGFEPIPVKLLDGVPVMTDGHTRAVAALLAGVETVPLAWDGDPLDWEMYRRCVTACRERGVLSPRDLLERIVSPADYAEKWDKWCDAMQEDVIRGRRMRGASVQIKKMETDEEIRGKAYVHWKAWHEAYPGMVSEAYLDKLTLEKCEKMAYSWQDNLLVAKDGDRVVGFVGYGDRGEEAPGVGEVFALYVLSEYYGTGVARRLMETALARLRDYPEVCLWVLKENGRARRFYEKCGFRPDGEEMVSPRIDAAEIRMTLQCGGADQAAGESK